MEEGCEHDFHIKERYLHRGSTDVKNSIHAAIHNENLKVDWKTKDGFCQKCGAWKGQLGLEPSLELYLKHMLQVTSELKRVLKKTGTMFWNHGDSYGGGGTGQKPAIIVFDKSSTQPILKTQEASFSHPNLKRIGYPKCKTKMKCKTCGDNLDTQDQEFYEDSCHSCEFRGLG